MPDEFLYIYGWMVVGLAITGILTVLVIEVINLFKNW